VDQGVFDVSLVLPLLLAGEGVKGAGPVSLPRNEVLRGAVVDALVEEILDQRLVVGLVCGERNCTGILPIIACQSFTSSLVGIPIGVTLSCKASGKWTQHFGSAWRSVR
jgi:hypothetical protein